MLPVIPSRICFPFNIFSKKLMAGGLVATSLKCYSLPSRK